MFAFGLFNYAFRYAVTYLTWNDGTIYWTTNCSCLEGLSKNTKVLVQDIQA
jgi:hypothetical protein